SFPDILYLFGLHAISTPSPRHLHRIQMYFAQINCCCSRSPQANRLAILYMTDDVQVIAIECIPSTESLAVRLVHLPLTGRRESFLASGAEVNIWRSINTSFHQDGVARRDPLGALKNGKPK